MSKITEEDKKYLLSLKPSDVDFNLLCKLFADTYDMSTKKIKKSKFNTFDTMDLAANEYINKTAVHTTVGSYIFNKVIVERNFRDIVGYYNEVITDKMLGSFESILSEALSDDRITMDNYYDYLRDIQWLGGEFHHALTPSFSLKTLTPLKEVVTERDKLIKERQQRIDNGDFAAGVEIETMMISKAAKLLDSDPSMDLFKSGARGTFANNYKNTSIMKGMVFNGITGKFELVPTCYIEGIKKESMHLQGNAIIQGAYPKACGTAESGYLFKQLVACFQDIVLANKGTDCGSKGTLEFEITKDNVDKIVYRYIVEGNTTKQLTPEIIGKYIGKTVQMRSPMYCTSEKLCNVCAGDNFYKLGIENVGLVTAQISSDMLNASMKKFHDANIKVYEITPENMFI